MTYTVKQLSNLSGVSVRTLHFYDKIGLLKPAYYAENQYRHYEKEQLMLLQQILFFRELGFPLNKIQKIICSGDFDQMRSLTLHKQTLIENRARINQLINTIDNTISNLNNETQMQYEKFFEGLDPIKQKEVNDYLKNKLTKSEEDYIEQCREKAKQLTKTDIDKMNRLREKIGNVFVKAIKNNVDPSSPEIQELMQQHFENIKAFCEPAKEMFIKMNQLDIEHPESKKLFDNIHPKFADYFMKAIIIFAERNL